MYPFYESNTVKNKCIVTKFPILSFVLFIVCCGCGNSVNKQEIEVTKREITKIGGITLVTSKDEVTSYSLPNNFSGQIGSVNLSYLDLTEVHLKQILPNKYLIYADFVGSNLNDKQVLELSNCIHLRSLNFCATDISETSLKTVVKFPSLSNLSLDYCNITDEGLKFLFECKKLKTLSLLETHVTEAGIVKLKKNLPQLKEIKHSKVPSEKIRVALSNFNKSGAFIFIDEYNTEKQAVIPISGYNFIIMPKVDPSDRFKCLAGWRDSPQAGNWLKTVAATQEISFSIIGPTTSILNLYRHSSKLKQISKLRITGHLTYNEREKGELYFQDNDLALLAKVEISNLVLSTTSKITPAGMKNIPKIKGLKELTLNAFPCSQQVLESLAACKELEKLTLSSSNLAEIDFEVFAKTKSLKEIIIVDDCKNIDKESLKRLLSKRTDIKLKEKNVG